MLPIRLDGFRVARRLVLHEHASRVLPHEPVPPESERRLQNMLHWDVNNGVARRAWARNEGAVDAIKRAMELEHRLQVTVPHMVDGDLLDELRGELP